MKLLICKFLYIGEDVDDVPKADYKPPVIIPKEDYGEGCNSKVRQTTA